VRKPRDEARGSTQAPAWRGAEGSPPTRGGRLLPPAARRAELSGRGSKRPVPYSRGTDYYPEGLSLSRDSSQTCASRRVRLRAARPLRSAHARGSDARCRRWSPSPLKDLPRAPPGFCGRREHPATANRRCRKRLQKSEPGRSFRDRPPPRGESSEAPLPQAGLRLLAPRLPLPPLQQRPHPTRGPSRRIRATVGKGDSGSKGVSEFPSLQRADGCD